MTDAQKQQALYLLVEQSTVQTNTLVIAALVGLSLSLALLFFAYYLLNNQIKQRQQAEAKLRDLYDNTPCGYHSLDKDGIFIEINNTELSWLGYSREEIIGKLKFSSLLTPESLATFEKHFSRFLEQGCIKDLEFDMLRKDGTILPVLLNATAIKDTAGNFVASRSTLFDISKRQQVKEALRESEQRFQGLAEATFEGIVIHEQGKIIAANQSFANLFGYESGEVMGMEAKDFLTPESLALVMARTVNGDEKPYEVIGLKKDRTTLPLEVIGKNCIYQGRQVRVSSARDITEHKQAEERLKQAHDRLEIEVAQRTAELSKTNERLQTELRERQQVEAALQESEERFRSAFDNAAIGKALVALDGRWLKVNRSLCEIVGYCEQELLATTFQAITHPEDLDIDLDYACQLLEGKIRSYEMEKRYCHKLGHIVWILLSGSLVRDAEGKPLYFIAQIQDITLRKQAEQALRESEERYRAIVEDQTELITRFQPDGRLTFVNEACCRYFGQEREALIGNCYEPLIFEEDREAIAQFLSSLSLEHPVGTIEHRVVIAGEIRWMQWINRAIFDEKGRFVEFQSVGRDISDAYRQAEQRIQAEEALRESERRFRAIFDQTFQFIGLLKPDGTLLEANQTALDFGGISHADIIGRPFWEARWWTISAETQNQLKDAIRQAAAGEFVRYEVDVLGAGDTVATIDFSLKPVKDEAGNVILLIPEGRDISEQQAALRERKRVEEALRHSEALFRSLSESSPIGIFRTDAEGKCIYTNPRCQAICGFTFEEALGDGWMQFAHPDDLQVFLPQWSKATAVCPEFSGELHYSHRDGTIRVCRIRTAPIVSNEQELIGHVGTVEDITETQAIERMKKEFISIVSHELRTPLSSMRGSLGLLTTGVLDKKPETAKQMLKIAATETERLVRLVNDILDLERLESHNVELLKQWCDAATLMRQSVETLQSFAKENHITVSLSSPKIQIWADPDRIIQTLVNLLNNAIKFSPSHSTVTLDAEFQEDRILFQVKDQGRGIPADKLETIFGRFQQVDASDSRQKGGTGLGLAICKSIVQQHGGKIWAESVVGEGSSFYFTLPKPLD